jgi:hypothetical protein
MGGGKRCPFVGIDEWMMLGQALPQGGSFFDDVDIVTGLGPEQRSFEMPRTPHSGAPAGGRSFRELLVKLGVLLVTCIVSIHHMRPRLGVLVSIKSLNASSMSDWSGLPSLAVLGMAADMEAMMPEEQPALYRRAFT